MRRRRGNDEILFSLDSFLDIVTNVVGVLVLVAMVTVVSAGKISVPSGATAATAAKPTATRLLFECSHDEVFFVDEEGNGRRVLEEASHVGAHPSRNVLAEMLEANDVGDATHRVHVDTTERNLSWVYTLRPDARGEGASDLDREGSDFRRRLGGIEGSGFAYFVVHDDSFEVFRKARDLARTRGIAVGWHPVEGHASLRLSANGSLGKRTQ
jgi:hypothetical protein